MMAIAGILGARSVSKNLPPWDFFVKNLPTMTKVVKDVRGYFDSSVTNSLPNNNKNSFFFGDDLKLCLLVLLSFLFREQ